MGRGTSNSSHPYQTDKSSTKRRSPFKRFSGRPVSIFTVMSNCDWWNGLTPKMSQIPGDMPHCWQPRHHDGDTVAGIVPASVCQVQHLPNSVAPPRYLHIIILGQFQASYQFISYIELHWLHHRKSSKWPLPLPGMKFRQIDGIFFYLFSVHIVRTWMSSK